METVIDALKAMGKASYREVAARLKVEPVEALNMLREQRESGICDFTDGGWYLTGDVDAKQTMAADKTALVKKITERTLIDAIQQHGPQTAEELASMFGVTSRKVASTLAMATKKSRVHRVAKDSKYRYCLPNQRVLEMQDNQGTSEADPQPEIAARTEHKAEGVEAVISTDKRAEDLIIPNVRYISNEIRRTKAKLERLYKLRDAAREVSKQSLVLKQLSREVAL